MRYDFTSHKIEGKKVKNMSLLSQGGYKRILKTHTETTAMSMFKPSHLMKIHDYPKWPLKSAMILYVFQYLCVQVYAWAPADRQVVISRTLIILQTRQVCISVVFLFYTSGNQLSHQLNDSFS